MKTRFRMPPSDDDLDLLRFHLAGAADSALAAWLLVTPLEQVELGIEMLDSVTRKDPEYRGAGERSQIRLAAIRKRVSPEAWQHVLDFEDAVNQRADRMANLAFRLGLAARVTPGD